MNKVDWLAACIVLVSAVAYNLHSPPMGSQWEERSGTKTNRKQRKLDNIHADNIIKPT